MGWDGSIYVYKKKKCLLKQFEFNLQKTVSHFNFPSLPPPLRRLSVRFTGSITTIEGVEDLENELFLKTSFGLFVLHRIVSIITTTVFIFSPRTA